MRLLVAGGAGFIGSNYVRLRLDRHTEDTVRVLDKLTYAGRRENLDGLPEDRLELIEADIADRDAVRAAVERSRGPSRYSSRWPVCVSRPFSTISRSVRWRLARLRPLGSSSSANPSAKAPAWM